MHETKSPVSLRGKPRTLRMRLLLWYGSLLVIALSLFVALILLLTMNALEQNVDSDVQAEARVASLNISSELSTQSPYWPSHLSLDTIDAYREPGVVVDILDTHGLRRYHSGSNINSTILINTYVFNMTLAGQTTRYTATISGERVRVEVLPIHAAAEEANTSTSGKANNKSNTDITPLETMDQSLVN